jgi:protein-S-isoprenylcysteine O-methyltransferase Ste14
MLGKSSACSCPAVPITTGLTVRQRKKTYGNQRFMRETPNKFPWPPVLYGMACAASLALHRLVPVPWPDRPVQTLLLMLGIFLWAIAFSIEISAALQFRRSNTTILPHRPASRLITAGPYRWSRNPIYLANTLLLIGAGTIFGMAWFIPAAIVAATFTHVLAVKREEAHLANLFGTDWTDYAKKVPRWMIF